MKTYNCKLRLAGAVTNEVQKAGVSAAEIEVLRELHGSDSIVDIKDAGDNKRTSVQERAYLRQVYANPEQLSAQILVKKQAMLRNLFGHDRMDLPNDVSDPAERAEEEDFTEQADAVPEKVTRTRVPKAKAEPEFTE